MTASPMASPLLRLASGIRPAIWPVVELMATVAAQLVLTPFLLHRLGTEQFAVWVIAQTMLMASATLSLGTGTALLPAIASARSRDDASGAWSAMRLFLRRASLSSLALLGAVAVAIQLHWVRTSEMGQHDLLLLALATLAWVSATEFDSGFSSALKALGRFNTVAQLEVACRVVQVGLTLTLVAAGMPALAPVCIAAAVTVCKAACKYTVLHHGWPRTDPAHCAGAVSPVPRQLSAAGAWAWVGVGSGLVFYAFDRWFIGAWLGSSVLASYAICSQLAQLPHAVVSAAGQTLVPWAAQYRDRLADPVVRHGARKLMVSATIVAALPSLLLLLLLEPVLSLWISREFAATHLPLARGMTVVFLLLSLNVPSYFLQFGFARFRVPMLIGAFAGAVFMVGCLLLPPSLTGFVAMKGLFGVLTLSLVVHFMWSSGARP